MKLPSASLSDSTFKVKTFTIAFLTLFFLFSLILFVRRGSSGGDQSSSDAIYSCDPNGQFLLDKSFVVSHFARNGINCFGHKHFSPDKTFTVIPPQGALKIYIYSEKDGLPKPPASCENHHPTSFESPLSIIPAWLKENGFVTDNPIEAHLFMVPTYLSCKDDIKFHISIFQAVEKTNAWKRNMGRDHFIIFPSGSFSMQLQTQPNIKSMIVLTPDIFFLTDVKVSSPVLDVEKDVAIPGYVNPKKQPHTNRVVDVRTYLARYVGKFTSDQSQSLKKLKKTSKDEKDIFISDNVESSEVDDAKLTFVPEGKNPSTPLFFETLLSESIPVIFDNRFHFPFNDYIPWEHIIVRWPENQINSLSLVDYLRSFSPAQLREKQQLIQKYKNQIAYSTKKHSLHGITSDSISERHLFFSQSAFTRILQELMVKYCTIER